MSKIYVVTDLQTSESFVSFDEAQNRLDEWIQDAIQNAKDWCDGQEYTRLYDEYTRASADSDMIRLWEVDLDTYDGTHDDCGYWPCMWDDGAWLVDERCVHNDEIRALYREAMEYQAGAKWDRWYLWGDDNEITGDDDGYASVEAAEAAAQAIANDDHSTISVMYIEHMTGAWMLEHDVEPHTRTVYRVTETQEFLDWRPLRTIEDIESEARSFIGTSTILCECDTLDEARSRCPRGSISLRDMHAVGRRIECDVYSIDMVTLYDDGEEASDPQYIESTAMDITGTSEICEYLRESDDPRYVAAKKDWYEYKGFGDDDDQD